MIQKFRQIGLRWRERWSEIEMLGIFSYDGKIMSLVSKITDCIVLSVFWIATALPIFTIGVSTTALYYAVEKSIIHDREPAWKAFFYGFKSNFKQSTASWLVLLAVLILGTADCVLLNQYGADVPLAEVSGVVVRSLLIAVVLWALVLLPYIARFTDSMGTSMKKSAAIMIANFGWAALLLMIFAAAIIVTMMLPAMICVSPVMYTMIANLILERIFKKYAPK